MYINIICIYVYYVLICKIIECVHLQEKNRYHEDIFGSNVRKVEQISVRPAGQSTLALAFLSSSKMNMYAVPDTTRSGTSSKVVAPTF